MTTCTCPPASAGLPYAHRHDCPVIVAQRSRAEAHPPEGDLRKGVDPGAHCTAGSTHNGDHGFKECPLLRWSEDGNTATCSGFLTKRGAPVKLAFGRACYHIKCRACRNTPMGNLTELPTP